MPIYATKTAFTVERTVPALLQEPISDGQILVFDAELGVFVNESFGSALTIDNTGSGDSLVSIGNSTLTVKTLNGGHNITLTDDGYTVTINNDSTAIVANMSALNALGTSSDTGRSALVLDTGLGQAGLFVWNGTWIDATTGGGGQIGLAHANFDHTTTSPLAITTLPPLAVIMKTQVTINSAFNGLTPTTMVIGTPAETNMLIDDTEVDMTQVKSFIDDTLFILPNTGSQQINAYFSQNGATTGSGTIFVQYSLN